MDSESGNSVEFEAHAYNYFDNGGHRPMLMELILLAEQSAEALNDLFNKMVVEKITGIPLDRINLNMNDETMSLIIKEMDEVYPLKR